mgnify:CR=1 FL=1
MKMEKLKNIFKRNILEKERIARDDLKKEVKEDRLKIVERENNYINVLTKEHDQKVDEITTKYDELDNCKDAKEKRIISNDIDELEDDFEIEDIKINKYMQGKKKNIISSYFGQIDKRINNRLFRKTKVGNYLWDKYSKIISEKYNNFNKYLTINTGVLLSVVGLGMLFSMPLTLIAGCGSLIGLKTLLSTISMKYNKDNFGGPLLKRFKTIYKGNYFDNIKTSKYAYNKAKVMVDDNIIVAAPMDKSNIRKEFNRRNEELKAKELERNIELEKINHEEVKNEIDDEDIEVMSDINDDISLGIQLSDNDLSYLKAYSTIRKSNDNNDRIDAYSKLATTYGKNAKKKKDTDIEKLNYYSRRLKALSEYGRKIHEGVATKEEQELYLALLYNLGKDFNDDDVMDYLSNVYEKQKVLVK